MQYGHFDTEHDEYVIDRVDLPTSWTNYLGVEDMCAVVNHTAGGYCFYKTPEYHRITRFRGNGVPMDRPGYDIYLRDANTGDYWSVSWQPVGKSLDEATYTCRHGLSYSVYTCEYSNIHAEQKMSIPLGENALIWDVALTNNGDESRELDVFSYAEFSYHHVMIDNQNFQMSLYCAGSDYEDGTILYDLYYEEEGYQYFTANFEPDGFDCLRNAFLGTYGSETKPDALERGYLTGSKELGNNHCAALQKKVTLEPGETVRLIYFLGEGRLEDARAIREKYADPSVLDQAYADLRAFWKRKQNTFRVSSPDAGVDTMINAWTLYQSEINIMFSRFASFIEVGGRSGLGYRDTAQDAMTVIPSNPDKCKQRIVELLRALTSNGYGIHLFEPDWFKPEEEKDEKKKPFVSPTVIPEPEGSSKVHGLKDACSDDALWLLPTINEYVKETGDRTFYERVLGYAGGGQGTVYEHMKKIVDFSLRETGSHGICKGLRADWNDCLNLGGGETTLVSFLLYAALNEVVEAAHILGKHEDELYYRQQAVVQKAFLNRDTWDGKWFIRGYTRSGRKIGSAENEQGKIFLESNAWAVLSGAASDDHAEAALDAMHEYLATPYGIELNWPPFTKADDEVGFVGRVYPGLKENASIFSHPNPWVWSAECRLGHGNRAMEYYHSLCPYYQNDAIEVREAEPYSYCQFISGRAHSTYGRAHHPFMTGSGGWSYFATTHWILGIRPDFDQLIVDPCIPSEWDGSHVVREFRGATYDIMVSNLSHSEHGVKKIRLDGKDADRIPLFEAGTKHVVEIEM